VCAVRRTERIVDVAIGIRSEPLDELFLRALFQCLLGSLLLLVGSVFGQAAGLALLLGIETQVFEQHHLAGLEVCSHLSGLLAHAVAGKHHLHAQAFLDGGDDLLQRELGIGILLGTSQVRHQDDRAALFEHLLDGGDRRTDAGIVRHLALLVEGHVEIHADDRALAFEIVIVDCEHSSLILNYFVELIFHPVLPGQIYENNLKKCYSDNRKNNAARRGKGSGVCPPAPEYRIQPRTNPCGPIRQHPYSRRRLFRPPPEGTKELRSTP